MSRTPSVDQVAKLADPNAVTWESLWEEEWKKHLYEIALEEVKRRCSVTQLQAFDLFVHRGWSAPEVANSLGINRAQVYLAKHRVARRLQEEIERLEKPDGLGLT